MLEYILEDITTKSKNTVWNRQPIHDAQVCGFTIWHSTRLFMLFARKNAPFLMLITLFTLSNYQGGMAHGQSAAQTDPPSGRGELPRIEESKRAFSQSTQATGLLVPLYLYPANIHTNDAYNKLMGLKRDYESIPFLVILNPASGPGKNVDANYTKAIDRLIGAGCHVLGYVSTEYGKRDFKDLAADLESWRKLYPRTQGIFFDEMLYENKAEAFERQAKLKRGAEKLGFWPTVANPGADTPEGFFKNQCADIIVVHEGDKYPDEKRIHGDYFGGYSDYPASTRAVLVHSMPTLETKEIAMIRKYAKWIYVTEDLFRAGDPKADNPWDSLSIHCQKLCEAIAAK